MRLLHRSNPGWFSKGLRYKAVWKYDLADLGAGALLFSLLWTAGMTSGEVNAQTSGMLSHKDILMQEADGWVEVYKINDETFVTVKPVLYSDFAEVLRKNYEHS